MRLPGLRRLLALSPIVIAAVVSVGGGGTYVVLEVTTRPQFCTTCHIMEPYYESWKSSSHRDVTCVDCHYEPGLLETFEGKFKALSQLAKYVTGTEGTKPWAEVSDSSCMRSGCHSERLLEGEVSFGRIRFDHRPHLIRLRRGKELRCTSCHSQIVQEEHLTVAKSTCILCHFHRSAGSKPIGDCGLCHGPPPEEIRLGDLVFRHSDYLERGVGCASCHGDVTRGTGSVPRERCGSCHNKPEQLERYADVDLLHRSHVTDHSVDCLGCHTEIEHSLPPRAQHFQGDCRDCHVGSHGVHASVYRGTGGREVADRPGVMFLARVTCGGCHRAPFPGAPVPTGGTTFAADPLACIDCHGPGYEGMAERWQGEVDGATKRLQRRLAELHELLGEEWEEGDLPEARRRYETAAHNLGLVLLDRSRGVHNLPYVRDLLRRADEDARAGFAALDPGEEPRALLVGPRVGSREGCTQLCHVGVEGRKVAPVHGLPFAHAAHLLRARLDCGVCHRAEPHGTTTVQRSDCVSCHHRSEEAEGCATCHGEVDALWRRKPAGVDALPMGDLDCLACHEGLAEGHSREGVRAACDGCHDDLKEGYFDAWLESARAPLRELQAALDAAPPAAAADVRRELEALRRAGPFHNGVWVRARARVLLDRLRK
ncbi:MAG: cytochrome c3 family protein [Planctomycetota bacterium]